MQERMLRCLGLSFFIGAEGSFQEKHLQRCGNKIKRARVFRMIRSIARRD